MTKEMSDDIQAEAERLLETATSYLDSNHRQTALKVIAAALRRQRENTLRLLAAKDNEGAALRLMLNLPLPEELEAHNRDAYRRGREDGAREVSKPVDIAGEKYEAYKLGMAQGVREEREACAEVAEECYHRDCHHGQEIAEAIRERGEKP